MTDSPASQDSAAKNAATPDEASRLAAVRALHILDTPPEQVFDDAAQLAATVYGVPIAFVSILDKDRQFLKTRVGLPVTELPREGAFCNHVIGRHTPLVVPDTATDPKFADNPFVTGAPNLRFYAGMPLNTSEGHTIGTLCVGDTVPHQPSPEQMETLTALGRQVAAQMELRAKVQDLAEVLQQKERIERELRERSLLFSAFMDHSPTIGFIKDHEGRFLYYNRVFSERFAVSSTEWIGKNVFDLFPEEFANAYHALDMAVLESGVSQVVDETSPGPGNTTLFWRTHKFCIAHGSEPSLLGGLSLDISHEREAALKLERSHAQLEALNQELTELSLTDGLTGVRNRRAFDERLTRKFGSGMSLSLILLDVDRFKSLNDSFGHAAGDEVLRTIAWLLVQNARLTDYVARFGGEEFAVLLPHTGLQEALGVAERLRAAIADHPWPQRALTISAGIATRSPELNSATALIEAADTALYCAKERGRNRVESAAKPMLMMGHCAA